MLLVSSKQISSFLNLNFDLDLFKESLIFYYLRSLEIMIHFRRALE